MKRFALGLAVALTCSAAWASVALAADAFTTFGGTQSVELQKRDAVYSLVSNTANASTADDYSGLEAHLPKNTTFGGLNTLSTDYFVRQGNCGGGSPRFQIGLDTDNDGARNGSVFVYIGDAPSFSCSNAAGVWQTTGNLIGNGDLRFDTSQLGGTFYDSYAHALAAYGAAKITSISLVADGGWAVGGVQDVLVDDPIVNAKKFVDPFGGAALTSPGNRNGVYSLVSNTSNQGTADDYSGVSYTKLNDLTFAGVTELSTDYAVRAGGCAGGSPRFSVGLDTDGNGTRNGSIFVYVGDAPSFTCSGALGSWHSTGNLIGSSDLRFDTSQLGGTFYDSYAHALAAYGSAAVTSLSFVVDAGWAFPGGVQDVLVDDLTVNGRVLQ
jgi:hypothetical protein